MIKLYYHGGSGNHGCEAIVRGTRKILDVPIALYTMRIEEDKEYKLDEIVDLRQDEVDPVKLKSVKGYLCRVYNRCRRSSKMRTYFERKKFLKEVEKGDVYLSIGGDNYCYSGYEVLSDLNSLIKRRGAKTVLWGCSVEPDVINKKTIEDFKRYDLIVARESITYNELKKINRNTKLLPDPAFTLDIQEGPLPSGFQKNNTVGINLSPLILKNEKVDGITLKNYENLIEYIIDKTDYQIALIAHVVWGHDDDRQPIERLFNKYKNTGRIIKVEQGNAMQLKGVISKCIMFIGARTHATIAAYSTGVPTLVIGYSVKARGIAIDLFGTEKNYVLPVQSLKDEKKLIESFQWLDAKKEAIHKHLQEMLPEYLEKAYSARKEIDSFL